MDGEGLGGLCNTCGDGAVAAVGRKAESSVVKAGEARALLIPAVRGGLRNQTAALLATVGFVSRSTTSGCGGGGRRLTGDIGGSASSWCGFADDAIDETIFLCAECHAAVGRANLFALFGVNVAAAVFFTGDNGAFGSFSDVLWACDSRCAVFVVKTAFVGGVAWIDGDDTLAVLETSDRLDKRDAASTVNFFFVDGGFEITAIRSTDRGAISVPLTDIRNADAVENVFVGLVVLFG